MNFKSLFILPCLFSACLLNSEEAPAIAPSAATAQEGEISKLSEAFGHLIGKNIETLGVKFDIEKVVKGLQDSMQGKNSPMSEEECVQAISAVQEQVFKVQALENLKKAEEFMVSNEKEANIKVLEKGKLHYKVEKEGSGNEVLAHFSPVIRYVGKILDGTTFGSSKEDELISLDETIPGFNKGIVGMKEGEKRILYIHPDLAYGTSGFLPPNSLLQFEVEIVKAHVPAKEPSSSTESANASQEAEAYR